MYYSDRIIAFSQGTFFYKSTTRIEKIKQFQGALYIAQFTNIKSKDHAYYQILMVIVINIYQSWYAMVKYWLQLSRSLIEHDCPCKKLIVSNHTIAL